MWSCGIAAEETKRRTTAPSEGSRRSRHAAENASATKKTSTFGFQMRSPYSSLHGMHAMSAADDEPPEGSELLRELVDGLPERYRRTLTLFYYEDRSVSEVAGIPCRGIALRDLTAAGACQAFPDRPQKPLGRNTGGELY